MRAKDSKHYRLWSQIKQGQNGCWVWTGPIGTNGYGIMSYRWRTFNTHRLAYQEVKGPIPKDLEIDHLCMNKLCQNPQHLEAVTHKENMRRFWEHKRKGL